MSPSRGHWLPCSYPPCCGTHRQRPYYSWFHRRPRFWRSSLDPPRAMGPLSTGPKARFPVALGHRRKDRPYRQLHLLRSFLPSTSPFALTRVAPSLVAVTLLVFCPSRDQTAQTSDPRTRLRPCGLTLEPSPAGSDPRLQGPSRPLGSRVKPPQNKNCTGSASSAVPSPLQDRTAPPLGGDSFSPDLPTDGHPPALAFGASEYLGS